MKVKNYLAGLLIFFISCESKEFQFVLPINEALEFKINENDDSFEEVYILTWQDIVGDLQSMDDDVFIERVDIESIVIKAENYDQSHEGLQNLNLVLVTPDNLSTPIYVNKIVQFSPGYTEVAVTDLAIQGVNKLSEIFKGYISNSNFESVTFISSGNSLTENLLIKFDLYVDINATVIFSKDLKVPFFMGN
jgi:hypothetical protein